MKTFLLLLALIALPLFAAEKSAEDLVKIEETLKSEPDDPMLHYKKCQTLFAMGKEQEAIDHAAIALTKFNKANDDLAWMWLGSFTTDKYKVDVNYNMGDRERAEKKNGIVRPYSFRVWTKGEEPELVQILDFELGYSDGVITTAAVGEETEDGHLNFGIVDPKSDFNTIKKKVLEIINK